MTKKKKLEQVEIPVPAQQEIVAVPISALNAHPLNARVHDIATITESLKAHGQYVPVVVNKPNMTILKGHGTVEAMQGLGWTTANVVYIDVDEIEQAAIVAIDNKSSDGAKYNLKQQVELINWIVSARRKAPKIKTGVEQMDIFAGTGYDLDTFETLMAQADSITVTQLEETSARHADEGILNPEQAEQATQKQKAVSQVAQAKGFREVILMYPVDQYEAFMGRVKGLQKFWEIESVSLTILEMLSRTIPPTPAEVEAAFIELQPAIEAKPETALLTAFQAGVYTRAALAKGE